MAIRNTIEYNRNYRAVFPRVRPAKGDGWGVNAWYLERADPGSKNPALVAAGITGQIQAHRFPTLTNIDDPHDRKSITTLHQKDEVYGVYSSTIRTRGVRGVSPMVMICARWAPDDLAGRIMDIEKDWKVIRTPALGDDGESTWPPDVSADGTPCGMSTEELLKIRDQEPYAFVTQYQALPPSAGLSLFRWWTEGEWPPVPGEYSGVLQSWDTAFAKGTQNDNSAMVETLRLKDGRLMLSHAWKAKLEFPMLKRAVLAQNARAKLEWGGAPLIMVEGKASGPSLVQDIRAEHPDVNIFTREIPKGNTDLYARAVVMTGKFASGRVVIPDKWTPWLAPYMAQMQAFTGANGESDDWVSATLLLMEYCFSGYLGSPPQATVTYGRGW